MLYEKVFNELTDVEIVISILAGFYLYAVASQMRSWYEYVKQIEKDNDKERS